MNFNNVHMFVRVGVVDALVCWGHRVQGYWVL